MDFNFYCTCHVDDTGTRIILWRYGAPEERSWHYYAKFCRTRCGNRSVGVDRLFTRVRSGYKRNHWWSPMGWS